MKCMLFSMPACPKCALIKQYFESKHIEVEEHSLADSEGVLKFRKLYPQIKDRVKRDENGSLPIPTILFFDESDNIVNIAHDLESIKKILENRQLVA